VSRRNLQGRFWPSAHQESLLTVALGDPASAVDAWRKLRPSLSLDELEPGSYELLPLVYRSLSEAAVGDADLPRLKGVYRKTWVTNTLLTKRTGELGETLREASIPALFVEGVALATRVYPELGLRPTSAIDVLVDEGDRALAVNRLRRVGWDDVGTAGGTHVSHLRSERGEVCLLRTKLSVDFFPRSSPHSSNEPLRSRASQYAMDGVEVLVTTPGDTFLAVCVVHARLEDPRNVQWVADAKMLLGAEIDWSALLAAAIENGQSARLRDALRYLDRLPGAKPPRFAIEQLATAETTRRDRLAYACASGSIRGLGSLPLHAADHLAATADESPLRTIAGFPGHLRERWKLASAWQLPLAAAGRGLRLLGRRDGTI
jgi:hypothetical protein